MERETQEQELNKVEAFTRHGGGERAPEGMARVISCVVKVKVKGRRRQQRQHDCEDRCYKSAMEKEAHELSNVETCTRQGADRSPDEMARASVISYLITIPATPATPECQVPGVGVGRIQGAKRLTWDERYSELKEYKAEHGHCNVPWKDGSLGSWVQRQRSNRQRGALSEERVRRLADIGFNWDTTRGTRTHGFKPQAWDARYSELKEYKAVHGHCNVPWGQGSLGVWVSTQRAAYQKVNLSSERIQRLNDIGFDWVRGQTTWDERYDELKGYLAEHGHCNVPQGHGPVGVWVNNQRQRKRKDKLDDERVRRLADIGFNWGTTLGPRERKRADLGFNWDTNDGGTHGTKRLTWDERYSELKEYKVEHGHCNVPRRQGSLGVWVQTQRAVYQKGNLASERIQRLDDIGFDWARGPTWEERYDELKGYMAEHGHCNVPLLGHGPLGNWVGTQRAVYKKGNLSSERIQRLDDIGFDWARRPTTWDERYNELKGYLAEHGNCNVPLGHGPLGVWVKNQRRVRKKGSLPAERVQRLDDIGFKWAVARGAARKEDNAAATNLLSLRSSSERIK